MNVKSKRDRTTNFTCKETDLLVNLVYGRKAILENKKSDAVTWRNKVEEWRRLEDQFNALSCDSNFRSARHLRTKYESLKSLVRKKSAYYNRSKTHENEESNKTSPLTEAEAKVMNMITSGVEPMPSQFSPDDDNSILIVEKNLSASEEISEIKHEIALLQRDILLKELQDKEIDRERRKKEFEEKEKEWSHNEEMRRLQKEKILLEIKKLKDLAF